MTDALAETRVTVVTVTYNSSGVLADMVASVPEQTPVVVVDNASTDLSALREIIAARSDKTQLIESGRNLGFGVGCNTGADLAQTEFLLFLNPDTVLMPDTLRLLVDAADRHAGACGFNPRILGTDGKAIIKRRSDLVLRSAWLTGEALTHDTALPVLSGAALFVRRQDFEAVGGFDPNIFLFFEDDDLSLRLSGTGKNLMYIHAARVRHASGASSGWSPRSEAIKNWHWGYSQIYTMRKHGRGAACTGAILKTLARAMSPITVLSRKRRQKYARRLSGMLAAIRRREMG